ncbi:ABC transporter ATP-binding protein [Treponema phagedenis]|uniref:ABC transporter ATP-binding protein n=1 Tax=Treponema phagedenis TaxID=162 RepID=A0A0B7GSA6_TREPH|nr:ABC transporter ATP-binding protein [Treponema phagedenis]EFW37717.1 ABC transporter, ATP-binding protein [Treponema phagedenis F0421]NVP24072.1 ABC transporter ATP-binding protein [Treponema phagedenis]QEJ96216.1 ABC transporter ATP-binding protein [Treponema phagedenis]QEJ99360.1 ABC transporter ATP-binding protein [Treponema phagedenis]QEJ99991.1 ABC transporter ATP-binding protein [Treponema phagedenis]
MDGITFKNVSKRFDKKQVLKDLSFVIKAGECFTILGPSGCGKTVILRLIAGFEVPDSGQIIINDQVVADGDKGFSLPPEERKLGVVFQDYAVWPHKTVKQNVAYPLEMQKVPADARKQRIQKAIDLVNLTGLEKRLPYQLSGGQQQRVALARAIVAESSLLLLDEPLTNLDANLREEMRFEIKALQKKINSTILYVTHDQEVALAISDRIAIMDSSGSFCQIDTPEQVFEHPVNVFGFGFLGVANYIRFKHAGDKILFYHTNKEFIPTEGCSEELAANATVLAAFRPMDVNLDRSSGSVRGTIIRKSLLGPIIDYAVELEGVIIRAQIQTEDAIKNELIFEEGEKCFCSFNSIVWFPDDAAVKEVEA